MGGANASDDKLLHIALAQAQGIENPLPASLKRAILHLDAGVSVIADIGQRGDVLAPIHVAETGQFRAHEIERVGHHADLAQLFGEELDILEVDVIDPIFKFIERLQIVDLLPDEVGASMRTISV